MGGQHNTVAKYINEKPQGESRIMRSLYGDEKGDLISKFNGFDNMKDIFEYEAAFSQIL